MKISSQLAKSFREAHFGGNWTSVSLVEQLQGITWQQAKTQLYDFNTIATLVFHMNYFVVAVIEVLEGRILDASDKFSFGHPPLHSEADWQQMIQKTIQDAERFAALVEALPDEQLPAVFADVKYGNYYRNIQGVTEHLHYHLGQIILLKKILLSSTQN